MNEYAKFEILGTVIEKKVNEVSGRTFNNVTVAVDRKEIILICKDRELFNTVEVNSRILINGLVGYNNYRVYLNVETIVKQ